MNMQTQIGLQEQLLVVSLNHTSVSLKDLHVFSFTPEQLDAILRELKSHPAIEECVGLCTCNRTEFFAAVHSVKDAAHEIAHIIAAYAGVGVDTLRNSLDVMVDTTAVEHLLRLISGLESVVIGDAQILGQLKEAYHRAVSQGTASKNFHVLFQKAFSVAKRIRTETGLGKGRVSISALAVDCAREFFGSLSAITATVIGAGKMGTLTAKYLKDAGVKELRIVNRSSEKSLQLAQEVGGRVYGLDELDRVLLESDLVITGTASPEPLITQAAVQKAAAIQEKKRLLIDIAVPPDIEPEVGSVPGVTRLDLEEFRTLALKNAEKRSTEIARAKEIIEEELEQFGAWPFPHQINSIANQLGTFAGNIYEQELANLLELLPNLPSREKDLIRVYMKRVAERIVLTPRRNLRKHGTVRTCPEAFQCISELFKGECGARSQPPLETVKSHKL